LPRSLGARYNGQPVELNNPHNHVDGAQYCGKYLFPLSPGFACQRGCNYTVHKGKCMEAASRFDCYSADGTPAPLITLRAPSVFPALKRGFALTTPLPHQHKADHAPDDQTRTWTPLRTRSAAVPVFITFPSLPRTSVRSGSINCSPCAGGRTQGQSSFPQGPGRRYLNLSLLRLPSSPLTRPLVIQGRS
jgi:hypothetical protein